jgi:hypothetical protein
LDRPIATFTFILSCFEPLRPLQLRQQRDSSALAQTSTRHTFTVFALILADAAAFVSCEIWPGLSESPTKFDR